MCSTKYYAQGSIFSCPLRRCVWTHLTSRGWPSTWNRLYLKGRKTFHEHGIKSAQFKFYRNAVNRERKSCKAVLYETKVQSMKEENPKAWWRDVKRLFVYLHRTGERYRWGVPRTNGRILPAPPTGPNPPERTLSSPPGAFRVAHCETLSKIKSVSGVWSCGPDEVSNWLLPQYSELLAYPVLSIINASLRE